MLIQPHIKQANKTKGDSFDFTNSMKQKQTITSAVQLKQEDLGYICHIYLKNLMVSNQRKSRNK